MALESTPDLASKAKFSLELIGALGGAAAVIYYCATKIIAFAKFLGRWRLRRSAKPAPQKPARLLLAFACFLAFVFPLLMGLLHAIYQDFAPASVWFAVQLAFFFVALAIARVQLRAIDIGVLFLCAGLSTFALHCDQDVRIYEQRYALLQQNARYAKHHYEEVKARSELALSLARANAEQAGFNLKQTETNVQLIQLLIPKQSEEKISK